MSELFPKKPEQPKIIPSGAREPVRKRKLPPTTDLLGITQMSGAALSPNARMSLRKQLEGLERRLRKKK